MASRGIILQIPAMQQDVSPSPPRPPLARVAVAALALAACGSDPAVPVTPLALRIALPVGVTWPSRLTLGGAGDGVALIAQTLRSDGTVLASGVRARWTSGDTAVVVVRDTVLPSDVTLRLGSGVMVTSRGAGQTTIEARADAGGGRTLGASLTVTVTGDPRP